MKPYQLVNSCKGGINHCMIDIIVTPINNQYKLIVQYNKKSANELRGEEKSFAEKFSKETYIGLKFKMVYFPVLATFLCMKLIICLLLCSVLRQI